MPQSLSHVLIHCVFSTKNREPFIDDDIEVELFQYLGGVCNRMECPSLKVGGYLDHVHVLCSLSRKLPIMDLLEEIKKRSSKWIKGKGDKYAGFYWQTGYAAFSVDEKTVASIIQYIENQKTHHTGLSFQDELRSLFKQHGIDWDERYVWD